MPGIIQTIKLEFSESSLLVTNLSSQDSEIIKLLDSWKKDLLDDEACTNLAQEISTAFLAVHKNKIFSIKPFALINIKNNNLSDAHYDRILKVIKQALTPIHAVIKKDEIPDNYATDYFYLMNRVPLYLISGIGSVAFWFLTIHLLSKLHSYEANQLLIILSVMAGLIITAIFIFKKAGSLEDRAKIISEDFIKTS